tara:strand:+ start:1335 stop:3455 length:2121 start_codon:yes stop_codon:yes gene_type:complete
MSKTTFLGYVPSLKSKHEATIVGSKAIESKGGSIRYMLQGEYDGRKTLPKTVSKAEFESIYGFDAKEAEAVYIKGNKDHNGVKNPQAIYHQVGKEDEEGFETTEIIPIENKEHASRVINKEMHKDGRIIHNVLPKRADTVGNPSPASVEPPAPSESPFPQEPSNENFSAFGFGKDEEEESDEPKTQEFTVILEEGDTLELTDVPGADPEKNEEDKDESEEKVEKDGESYEAVQAKVTRPVKEEEEPEEESDEGLLTPKNLAIGALGVGALALALGAEDDESDYWADEGQYTMNAEGFYESSSVSGDVDVSEQKRVHSHKDFDISSDYDGDLEIDDPDLDVPTVFEEYEDDLIEAVKSDVDNSLPVEDGETGTGSYDVDVEVELPVRVTGSVEYKWTSDLNDEDDHTDDDWNAEEVSEIEYDEYLDELGSDALTLYKDNPSQLFEKAYPIDYQVQMNDYESSLLADIQSGYTENSMMFDEDENLTPYGERVLKEMFDSLIDETLGIEWLASIHPPSELLKRGDPTAYRVGMSEYEDAFESESDGYAYAYTKGHNDGIGEDVIYRPSIATDRGKNIYKKILRQKAESFDNDFSHVKTYDDYHKEFNRIKKEFGYDGEFMRFKIDQLHDYCSRNVKDMMADTVGSPSPSGPSSTPEPAEATGSEPSNENFESPTKGNMKLIGGIGLVAAGLFALGKSDWIADTLNKYMK